jgi:hypothetical protein
MTDADGDSEPSTVNTGLPADTDSGTHTPDTDALDTETLLGDDAETFEAVLSGETAGPLAVVAPPFAGHERLLDAAADALDAERIRLGPRGREEKPTPVARFREALGDGPVVVENCQHLYERRVGGFEPLESALDALARTDSRVVTGWNRYAWSYLTAVRSVEGAFPATVETGPVATAAMAELLADRYGGDREYGWAEAADPPLVTVRAYELGRGPFALSVPVPIPTRFASSGDEERDAEAVVFERLAALSEGNLGVASAIWEDQTGDVVRPSDIVLPVSDVDLDREEAFCLRVVLAKERVTRAELAAVVGDAHDRIVARLARDGVVAREDGLVSLERSAVPTAAAETDRRRVL